MDIGGWVKNTAWLRLDNYIFRKWLLLFVVAFFLLPGTAFSRQNSARVTLSPAERQWLQEHSPITLGTMPIPPLIMQNQDGSLTGALVELHDLLNRRLGTDIRLKITGPPVETHKLAEQRALDGLFPTILPREKGRLDSFKFSRAIATTYTYLYCRLEDRCVVNSLDDLRGKKVGVLVGYYYILELLQKYPDISVVQFPNPEELLDALLEGRVDAVIGNVDVQQAAVQRTIQIKIVHVIKGDTHNICYSIRKDWPELVRIINKGLAAISREERNAVLAKWLIREPQGKIPVATAFTRQEKAWLQRHPLIRVASDAQWAPMEYVDKDGNYCGIAIDYLKIIEKRLGVRLEIAPAQPWHQLVEKAKRKEIDMFSCVARTPERSRYLSFTAPYISSPIVIFSRMDRSFIGNLDNLKHKKVAVVQGYAIQEILRNAYPELDIVAAADIEEALRLVDTGEVVAYVGNLLVTSHYIAKDNYRSIKVAGETPYKFSLAMAVRNDWPEFAVILQKALAGISRMERDEIYQKWLSINYKQGLDYALIWKIIVVACLVLAFFVFWNRKLNSEVKKRTCALAESEQKYRDIYFNSQVGMLRTAIGDGRILECNDKAAKMLGYGSREECMADWVASERYINRELRKQRVETIKEKNKLENYLFQVTRKDNTSIWVECTTILYREQGFYETVIVEVTARKLAEYERQKDKERLEARIRIQENSNLPENELLDFALEEAVRLTDSQCGYFHFVADGQIALHSWFKETLQACTVEKTSHYPIESAGVWADSIRLKKPVIHNDYPNLPDKKGYPEGHFTINRHMSMPVVDSGKIVAVLGVGNKVEPYSDVDQRQLELYLSYTWEIVKQKRHEEENHQVEGRLKQAQKMEAIGTLAGGIAHDFNNILGVILGYTEMAHEDAPPGSELEKDLEKVLAASHRARDLVRQILAFSRQANVERMPMKIQPLVKEGLKMLRASIPTTISITANIDPQAGVILADPTQIHQILINLCTNAYHAMESSGGELSVSLQPAKVSADQQEALGLAPGNYIKLAVSDTGVGIGPDVIGKIFDPYFTTKEVSKGTGMGLAIIHGIMQEYGGAITVSSKMGEGTTFEAYFPEVERETAADEPADDETPKGRERILFVDDEKLLADMGKEMLERLGYQVTVRRSGVEALAVFQNGPEAFDLVITDQTMPLMTGSDLARRMLQIRPDIPIILCTGYSNLIDEVSAKAIGIREFTLKPLTMETIATLIRQVLE